MIRVVNIFLDIICVFKFCMRIGKIFQAKRFYRFYSSNIIDDWWVYFWVRLHEIVIFFFEVRWESIYQQNIERNDTQRYAKKSDVLMKYEKKNRYYDYWIQANSYDSFPQYLYKSICIRKSWSDFACFSCFKKRHWQFDYVPPIFQNDWFGKWITQF